MLLCISKTKLIILDPCFGSHNLSFRFSMNLQVSGLSIKATFLFIYLVSITETYDVRVLLCYLFYVGSPL